MTDLTKLTAESHEDMLARVRLMATGTNDTWDLSDNDVLALKYVLERLEQCEADSQILDWLELYSSFGVHTYTEAGKRVVYTIDGGVGTAMHTRGSSLRDAARAALGE